MEKIITNFYQAFQQLDAETMVSFYHNDVVFEDPAFGILQGERAKNMWRMLCESQQGKDFNVTFGEVTESSAHWEAFYTFSKTSRKVHNKIEANFKFSEGKIIQHTDIFNLHRWASQALGLPGMLLGWSGFFKNKLNAQTNALLTKYEKSKNT